MQSFYLSVNADFQELLAVAPYNVSSAVGKAEPPKAAQAECLLADSDATTWPRNQRIFNFTCKLIHDILLCRRSFAAALPSGQRMRHVLGFAGAALL